MCYQLDQASKFSSSSYSNSMSEAIYNSWSRFDPSVRMLYVFRPLTFNVEISSESRCCMNASLRRKFLHDGASKAKSSIHTYTQLVDHLWKVMVQ